ncbi:MAG: HYR domain-containing protein, partial [bacterium]
MIKFLQKSLMLGTIALLLVCGFFIFGASNASAAVSITTATGGTNISADTTNGAWTSLGAITITELANGDIPRSQAGTTLILKAPAGFEFNTGQTPSSSYTPSRDISALSIVMTNATTITITLTTPNGANGDNAIDIIVIGATTSMQVRPTVSTLASGQIYRPTAGGGNAQITGITTTDNTNGSGGTNFGTLIEVAGTVKNASFVADSTTLEAGQTANLTITLKDQFNNLVVDGTTATILSDLGTITGLDTSVNGIIHRTVTHNNVDTVNLSATGLVANGDTLITFVDTTAPVISDMPSNMTEEATSSAGAMITYNPTANDTVDGSVEVICDSLSGSMFTFGDTIVTCTATDAQGNADSRNFTITVHDTTIPVINGMPSNIITEATSNLGATVEYVLPTATDLVDDSVEVTCDPTSGSTFALSETTITCTATDSHTNTQSETFTITVQDTTAPAITGMPEDIITDSTSADGAMVDYLTPTADDIVDGSVTVTCDPLSGSLFPIGQTTLVTCTAVDTHGQTNSQTFNITIQDKEAPVIVGIPDDITAEATSSAGAEVTYDPITANDSVDGPVPVNCDYFSGSTFPLGATVITCSAMDNAGNSQSASFSVIVQDTTSPIIGDHEPVNIEATSPAGADADYVSPMATDSVDSEIIVSCSPSSGTPLALDDTTITCNAQDMAGNIALPTTFTITVGDTTGPIIAYHENMEVAADTIDGVMVNYDTPIATDIVDQEVIVNCLPEPGANFLIGENLITCNAQDATGNEAEETAFYINVFDPIADAYDNVAAILMGESMGLNTNIGEVNIGNVSSFEGLYFEKPTKAKIIFTAPLNLQDDATINFLQNLGDYFSAGSGSVGFKAGSSTFAEHPAQVVLYNLNDLNIPEGYNSTDVLTKMIVRDDNGNILNTDDIVSNGVYNSEDYSFTFDATHFTSFDIDLIPPMIDPHEDITAEATSLNETVVTFINPTATDNVDAIVEVICNPLPGSFFEFGSTSITCTATDSNGNIAIPTTFTITIQDTTAPVITDMLSDITTDSTSADGATVEYVLPTALDAVDGPVVVICDPTSGSTFALGETTVTCTATDNHTNTQSGTFTITVQDKEAPTLDSYMGDGESDYELPLIGSRNEQNLFGTTLIFSEELSEDGRTAVEESLQAGADKTLTL